MSYCTDVYSHPDKLLTKHLLNVAEYSKELVYNLKIEDNVLLSEISFFIGLTHDFAKSTTYFQDHLFKQLKSKKSYHSFLSAILSYWTVKKYTMKHQKDDYLIYSIIAYIVVKNHHGNLKDLYEEATSYKEHMDDVDFQVKDIKENNIDNIYDFYLSYDINLNEFLSCYDDIKNDLKKDLRRYKNSTSIRDYSILLLLFSVLIDADKLDASYTTINSRIKLEDNLVDLYKDMNNFNSTGINMIREEAYANLNQKINDIDINQKLYSLSLPTGSGKTLSVLSFALKLRKKIYDEINFMPRIIYSLPFLSIIDQNEEVIRNVLSVENYDSQDIFIKHNSMSDIYYKTIDENELKIDNAELLIESWYSEIIITTFYQLLYTVISNKNRSLKKFHNLSNSIIILDEVQSIQPKYWKLINHLFKYLSEKYNIWIIFMTATQPAIFTDDEMIPLIENKEYYFKQFDRVDYQFNMEKQTTDEFCEEVIEEIYSNNKDMMIVVNTIQNSIDIFKYLSEYVDEEQLYYLSTNILPFERNERVFKIKNSKDRKIIVTTQLIEAGVDIDVDIIYRDFAPIDSIVQTAGRCNRNQNKERGIVHVIKLIDDNGKEFNSYIYDSISRDTTCQLVKNIDTVSEKDFSKIIDEYYHLINEKISKDDSNDLITSISKLKLSNITNDFKLIEENIQKQDVFIDLNEESHSLWTEYTQIYSSEKSVFDKKREFKKIKSKFRKYIISIDIKKLGTIPIVHKLGYVDHKDVKRKYDKQLGFISLDDEEAFII